MVPGANQCKTIRCQASAWRKGIPMTGYTDVPFSFAGCLRLNWLLCSCLLEMSMSLCCSCSLCGNRPDIDINYFHDLSMKMKQSVFKNACEMKSLEELLQFGTETAFHGQLSATEIPVLANIGATEEQYLSHWAPCTSK